MSYKVKLTPDFERSVKDIRKKHKAITNSLLKLIDELEENANIGTPLGQGLYKIRISIPGSNKGKSGGARVITCVVLIKETIYLSEIYLKSEHDTVDPDKIVKRLKELGLL